MPEGRPTGDRSLLPLLVVGLMAVMLAGCTWLAAAAPTSGVTERPTIALPAGFDGGSVAVEDLPPEAIDTLGHIADGGPFPYDQDGVVFLNRERLLPDQARGYYHEYTVETPGSPDRGARRIVTGDAGERYYTDDHYETFAFVVGDVGG